MNQMDGILAVNLNGDTFRITGTSYDRDSGEMWLHLDTDQHVPLTGWLKAGCGLIADKDAR